VSAEFCNYLIGLADKSWYRFSMRFLGSHVIHFLIMGLGISIVLGMLKPTLQPARTIKSMRNHALGVIGIGLVLAWIMYLLPTSPVRF